MTTYPYFGKILGGGESWYYLFDQEGNFVSVTHEGCKKAMDIALEKFKLFSCKR